MSRPLGSGERSRFHRGVPWPSWGAATVWAVSVAVGAAGLLAMAAGLVDLLGDGDDTVPLLVSGGSAGLLASVLAVWVRPPDRLRHADILCAVTGSLVLFIVLVSGLLLVTRPSKSLADALFQAATVGTTTALEIVPVSYTHLRAHET